HRQN
ncbi:phage recombination protein Bet, partial [Escherichia coli EC1847]